MICHGYFWMPVKHYLTNTELRTGIFIHLKQIDNVNYNGIDNEIEKLNENYYIKCIRVPTAFHLWQYGGNYKLPVLSVKLTHPLGQSVSAAHAPSRLWG